MGQSESAPASGSGSFRKQKPKKKRSGLANVLEGGNCERAPPELRTARRGGGSGGFFGGHARPKQNFNPSHVPPAPVRCTAVTNTHDSYFRQALQEEVAWQRQYMTQPTTTTAPSSCAGAIGGSQQASPDASLCIDNNTASTALPNSSNGGNAATRGVGPADNPSGTSGEGRMVCSAAAVAAARKRERRWWLMLCEVLIATQRLAGPCEADGNSGGQANHIFLSFRQAIREAEMETAAEAREAELQAATRARAASAPSLATRDRRSPSPAPSAGGAAAAAAARQPHKEKRIPLPHIASWCDFPTGRSTGVEYFALAPAPPAAAATDHPEAAPQVTKRNGDEGDARHSASPTIATTAATTAVDASNKNSSASGALGDGTGAPLDLRSLTWEVPPRSLKELPVGATYFSVLRKVWGARPPVRWGDGDPLDSRNPSLAFANYDRSAGGQSGNGSDYYYGSLLNSSVLNAYSDEAASSLGSRAHDNNNNTQTSMSQSGHGAAAAGGPAPPQPLLHVHPSGAVPGDGEGAEEITDGYLLSLVTEAPNTTVVLPAVPLTQMLRVLSHAWAGEGLYSTAGVPEPACVRALPRDRGEPVKTAERR